MPDAVLPLPDFCDPDLKPRFSRDGWVQVPALDPAGTAQLRGLWAQVGKEHPGSYSTTIEKATSLPLRRRVSAEVVGCLASFAQGLVRGYRVISGGFIVKRPGAGDVPLHRHPVLIDEHRHAALLCWIPLQDTSVESGCMTVAAGTHRSRPMLGHVFPPSEAPEARDLPLSGGEALIMDHRLVHGSRANRTAEERLAVGLLLVPQGAALRFCRQADRLLEVFEVPDDFYLRWLPGAPPPLEGPPVLRLPLLPRPAPAG